MSAISTKERIILGVILLLIVLIPTTSFFIAKSRTQTTTKASNDKPKFSPLPVTSPRELPKTVIQSGTSSESASDKVGPTEDTVAPLLGPTLDFTVTSEGRPDGRQEGKYFVGLAEGDPISDPQYLLSFVVNVPGSGEYKGLSLAGLDEGKKYSAYIKGPAQIASASAFIVNPTPTNLGTLRLVTGDVNEDNIIDQADYDLVKGAIGSTQVSPKWNFIYDFNLDSIINSWDLGIISKNMSRTGESGVWYSKVASSSGALVDEIKEPKTTQGLPRNIPPSIKNGHWMYFPPVELE